MYTKLSKSRVYRSFLNLKLNRKLAFGYLFIVVIPVLSITFLLFGLSYKTTRTSYLDSQQQEQTYFDAQLTALLNQLSNYTYFFQNNTEITAYLDNKYLTVSDILYNYFKSMSDTFSCYAYDSRITAISIYGYDQYALSLPDKLMEVADLKVDSSFITQIKSHAAGYWVLDKNGALTFYKMLYDKDYQKALGILVIKTDFTEILQQLTDGLNSEWFLVAKDSGDVVLSFDGATVLTNTQFPQEMVPTNSAQYLSTDLESIPYTLIQRIDIQDFSEYHIPFYLAVTFFSLLIFSFMYFMIARSMTKRLVDFNRFISVQDVHALTTYKTAVYADEIGSTISIYNQLIERINELIHNNYEVSLKMKEARYYALQAQIKPHFLYNILENIRMSSEQHQDPETANMTAVFGKYMRYAMNTSTEAVTLESELNSARDYLEVNQFRLGSQLAFSFSVETETDDVYCPRFILQPILENALKHGFIKGQILKIVLRVYDQASTLPAAICVEIKNNGKVVEMARLSIIQDILNANPPFPSSSHVGLRNVGDRLKAFNKDETMGLGIESSANGWTRVFFSLMRLNKK